MKVPDGAPRYRFMRYVRPPRQTTASSAEDALFPTRPNTRRIRVGLDVKTLPAPTRELMQILGRADDVEPILLVQNDDTEPTAWTRALENRRWYRYSFTTIEEAPRSGDISEVGVTGYEDGEWCLSTHGEFFGLWSQLDHSQTTDTTSAVALADRHNAAAITSAAAAIWVDVIVTASPTADRDDIANNDTIVSVTPEQLLPLFGHYLRMTGNPTILTRTGRLQGGGRFVRTSNANSIADLYSGGIAASVPHLTVIRAMATANTDHSLSRSTEAITLRLSRAARAVDTLLAALSQGSSSGSQRADIAESTAEAFDRVLLYLCAAMDRYARVTRTLFDTTLDIDKQSTGSLTSREELKSRVIVNLEPTDTGELERLCSYGWVTGQLRHRIHALPLDIEHRLSRPYGSSTTAAVALDGVPALDPVTTPLTQQQLDRLGVWNAESDELFGSRSYSADVATMATTLFQVTLHYLDEFSRLLLRTKVLHPTEATHEVLGCLADEPRPIPAASSHEQLLRDMFGWSDFG